MSQRFQLKWLWGAFPFAGACLGIRFAALDAEDKLSGFELIIAALLFWLGILALPSAALLAVSELWLRRRGLSLAFIPGVVSGWHQENEFYWPLGKPWRKRAVEELLNPEETVAEPPQDEPEPRIQEPAKEAPKVTLKGTYDALTARIRLTNNDLRARFRVQVQEVTGIYHIISTAPDTPYDLPWQEDSSDKWKELGKGEMAALDFAQVYHGFQYSGGLNLAHRIAVDPLPELATTQPADPFGAPPTRFYTAAKQNAAVTFYRQGKTDHVADSQSYTVKVIMKLAIIIDTPVLGEDAVQATFVLDFGAKDHFDNFTLVEIDGQPVSAS